MSFDASGTNPLRLGGSDIVSKRVVGARQEVTEDAARGFAHPLSGA